LGGGGNWAFVGFDEAWRIGEGVFEDDGVEDAYVLERTAVVVDKGVVELFQRVEAFCQAAEDGSLAVEVLDIVAEGYNELATPKELVWVSRAGSACEADSAALIVLQPLRELWLKRPGLAG
jgi:hypothetical protein